MSMEKKRPQLNLDELHQLKWLLGGVLALLSAWSVPYLDVNAWALVLAVTVLVPLMLVCAGLGGALAGLGALAGVSGRRAVFRW